MTASITPKADSSASELFVSFRLGDEQFAVDINKVVEIIRVLPITAAPGSRPYVLGVINLRGKIVTTIDLARRLGADAPSAVTRDSRIIILEKGARVVGVLVDYVGKTRTFSERKIEAVPSMIQGERAGFFKGIAVDGDAFCSILSVENIISHEK